MKILNGQELVDFIKERQAKQVRNLRQAHKVVPTLAIVQTSDNPVINMYVRLKKAYGADILIDVEQHIVSDDDVATTIARLNESPHIHGIIVQLPLQNPDTTDEILALVRPEKDVDGLAPNSPFDAATPTAINWLLTGYGIDLHSKSIAIIGQGKLVGAPLARMWRNSGMNVTCYDEETGVANVRVHDLIVTATGHPDVLSTDDIQIGAVVVDAGTASENGKIVGDVSDEIRMRDDLTITPIRGGVGPLTVAALFDNVITAARKTTLTQ